MLRLNGENFKVCYLDTNILRATLEMSQNIHNKTISKLADKSIFAISILTLVEISHIPLTVEKFIKLMKAMTFLIVKSSDQILEIEKKLFNQKIKVDDIIMLNSNPLQLKINDEIATYLLSDDFYSHCHIVKEEQTRTFERIKLQIESEKDTEINAEDFVQYRVQNIVGKGYSFTMDDSNFLSQKLVNLLLFYTYIFRGKSAQRSDPFDFLISSAVPYMDIFLTENSQAKSYHMIKENHNIVNTLLVQTMKDLRISYERTH